jgi:hypothetical protein
MVRVVCIVRVCLETWEQTPGNSWIVHSLIGGWVKPRNWPLGHTDVEWVKCLPRMNVRREIRMHNLLLFFLNFGTVPWTHCASHRKLFTVRRLCGLGILTSELRLSYVELRELLFFSLECLKTQSIVMRSTPIYLPRHAAPSGEGCIFRNKPVKNLRAVALAAAFVVASPAVAPDVDLL